MAKQTIKTTVRKRTRKVSGDKMVCNVCGGTGYQKVPRRKKK